MRKRKPVISTVDFKAMLKEKLKDLPRPKNPLVRPRKKIKKR